MGAEQLLPVRQRTLRFLERTPDFPYTAREVADALHPRAPEQQVRDSLIRLARTGQVERDVTGTGSPARFWVAR